MSLDFVSFLSCESTISDIGRLQVQVSYRPCADNFPSTVKTQCQPGYGNEFMKRGNMGMFCLLWAQER